MPEYKRYQGEVLETGNYWALTRLELQLGDHPDIRYYHKGIGWLASANPNRRIEVVYYHPQPVYAPPGWEGLKL